MVAYNFQRQFVEPIRSRTKTQTIRAIGKRRHARPGELLQLYTGQRTTSCEKILEEDPYCIAVEQVIIEVGADCIDSIAMSGYAIVDFERFAKEDGFKSLDEMYHFWARSHGYGRFEGLLIQWLEIKE